MPTKRKGAEPPLLKGWSAIAYFLAIPVTTAHRWAKGGMPVRREGRFTVANPAELQSWLGRESHMPGPARVATDTADLASALKESISAAKQGRKNGQGK